MTPCSPNGVPTAKPMPSLSLTRQTPASCGFGNGVPPETLESIKRNKICLKGPLATPVGGGYKSVNVALRMEFDLYANVRPIRSLPNVEPRFSVDMVIVRENTEGLYAGLELMILPGVAQSIKGFEHRGP